MSTVIQWILPFANQNRSFWSPKPDYVFWWRCLLNPLSTWKFPKSNHLSTTSIPIHCICLLTLRGARLFRNLVLFLKKLRESFGNPKDDVDITESWRILKNPLESLGFLKNPQNPQGIPRILMNYLQTFLEIFLEVSSPLLSDMLLLWVHED